MIQRKQSLFLLATAIIAIAMLFIPFQTIDTAGSVHAVTLLPGAEPLLITSSIYAPFILDILTVILSFVVIFLYKNRILQYKLANGLVVLNIFITGLFFLLSFTIKDAGEAIHFTFGAFLPIIGAAFAFFAGHFIKKDEQLVRSADRIR